MDDKKREQVEIAERLQMLLLKEYERRLLEKTISDTGMAALQRLLSDNGWTLDPASIPQGIKAVLTEEISPEELEDDDVIQLFKTGT